MNIVMLTNTYLPHVGGVARSVEAFRREYEARGHQVLVVAPEFPDVRDTEKDVIRVPAIQNFNASGFSVSLPIPGYVLSAVRGFRPDLVHSHHPFLLGNRALRIAAHFNVPLVFQHHTMYERFTHVVPGDSSAMKRFVTDLATGYANLCDQVFAPSDSVAALLRRRGVTSPIAVVPTGIDTRRFARGNGGTVRSDLGIPRSAPVIGHVGRLAPEKNLPFLAKAVARYLRTQPRAQFLLVGDGPSESELQRVFARAGLLDRLHLKGVLQGQALVDAYHAMDVFAFASKSETQGLVLAEAMAAGCPVVAIDAPGVREVVQDRRNGRLLDGQRVDEFAAAVAWITELADAQRNEVCDAARKTAERFTTTRCAGRALSLYQTLVGSEGIARTEIDRWEGTVWQRVLRRMETEWDLIAARVKAAGAALLGRRSWRYSLPLRFLTHVFNRARTGKTGGCSPGRPRDGASSSQSPTSSGE
jgi:glycosyltransferase involved in cell wall biosynthesis